MRNALLFILLFSLAFAQAGSSGTEGGNITGVEADGTKDSIWHGVVGQASTAIFVPPVTVSATPANITVMLVNTNISQCNNSEYTILNLLFSNSSTAITSLTRGTIAVLDSFIGRPSEDAGATFGLSFTFETANYGNITGVPSTYTNAPNPTSFPLGYLQDQNDNIVFITPVVQDVTGFNGTPVDFQLMLPTRNGTPVLYYLTIDLLCEEEVPPEPEIPPEEEGKPDMEGGGTRRPYWNVTEEMPPVGPAENITYCDIILYCGEWESCIDGQRQQRCWDVNNCSNIEVFRVEKCIPGEIPPEEVVEEEIIPLFVVYTEFPCLPLLLLVLLIIIIIYIYWRRKSRRGETT